MIPSLRKTAVAAVAAVSLSMAGVAAAPSQAHAGGKDAAIAALVGGIVIGAVIASQSRPAYAAPVYAAPAYRAPAYAAPVYVAPAPRHPVYAEPVYAEPKHRRWREERRRPHNHHGNCDRDWQGRLICY